MRLWRLSKEAYAADLSGMGGLFGGGRWHNKGTRIVYTSTTPSLCALEFLVHVDPLLAPANLRMVDITVPDDLEIETVADPTAIAGGWRDYPAPSALADFGSRWVREERTPLLAVPSALTAVGLDVERNFLLNPTHPLASSASIVASKPFTYDTRLLYRRPRSDPPFGGKVA